MIKKKREYKQPNYTIMEVRQTRIFKLNDKLTRAMSVIGMSALYILLILVGLYMLKDPYTIKIFVILLIGGCVALISAAIGYIITARELAKLDMIKNKPKARVATTYDPRA